MTDCISSSLQLPVCKGRKVGINFEGGDVTSDGGILLLSRIEQKLGLTEKIAKQFSDKRDQTKVKHSLLTMLCQRIYGIALGYEDLNDHNGLRHDTAFQTALHKDVGLASSPTLCRFKNTADRSMAWAIHQVLIEQFTTSHQQAPKELILDLDATNAVCSAGYE
jgi:hypothetical protein